MANDDVMLVLPLDQQAEFVQIAHERGATPGELIAEAVEAWSVAHADRDGTPGFEARVKREGRLSPRRLSELLHEAMTWWLANPTLRTLQ